MLGRRQTSGKERRKRSFTEHTLLIASK
ncbi:hypothetical protein LEMLEM_LOCUS10081 [Lemmus lemmus]